MAASGEGDKVHGRVDRETFNLPAHRLAGSKSYNQSQQQPGIPVAMNAAR